MLHLDNWDNVQLFGQMPKYLRSFADPDMTIRFTKDAFCVNPTDGKEMAITTLATKLKGLFKNICWHQFSFILRINAIEQLGFI